MSDQASKTILAAVDYDPFGDGPALERTVPTTEPQREIWLAAGLNPRATLSYNEPGILRLRGQSNIEALSGALRDLVDRHEALRATFSPDGMTLCIAAPSPIEIPVVDLTSLDAFERDRRYEDLAIHDVENPFDLQKGPLFRARIVRLGPEDVAIMLIAHHIVCDGWSYWVMVREIAALYALRLGRTVEPLPSADSFADYALGESSGNAPHLAADERYWLEQFRTPPPPLDLPADHPRPPLRSQRAGREDHVLEAELVAAIKKLGAQNGASLFVTLLASFSAFLHRLTRQTDIVVGIPAAAQSLDGHERLVGHCVNMLPLRSFIDPGQPLSALLRTMRSTMLDAYEHQRYTFGTLLKKLPLARDPSRLPLVSVVFNIDQAMDSERNSFPELEMEFITTPRRYENFELFINAAQVGGRLRLECQYNCDLFTAPTIRRWLAEFETFLREVIGNPGRALAELDVLASGERETLDNFGARSSDYPVGARACDLVAARATSRPEAVALTQDDQTLTYGQLEARSNQLARVLQSRGVGRGSLVGICMARSPDMVVTMLAVMKSGAAYLPLDPGFPAARLAFMVEDSAMNLVVSQSHLTSRHGCGRERTLALDVAAGEIEAQSASPLGHSADRSPEDVAYVLYTSGSTGRPKGVAVPHRATVNFLYAMQREPGLREDDVLVAVTTLSFDIAFLELMLPLSVGARIVMASRELAMDGPALRRLLETCGATVMQATPVTWRMLIDADWRGHGRFKAICGGEPMPVDLAEAFLERTGEAWNGYGPTETTVYSTFWRVEHPRQGIYIGRPVANTTVRVLDAHLRLCPIGVPGEIYIGGHGLALGYLNHPDLTSERFHADPYSAGSRLYRTGDIGRWHDTGLLEYLGRTDFQVKIRGFRIELGEIEAALSGHPGVKQAIAIVREDRPGDLRIVAYVIPMAGRLDEAALRSHLRAALPDYMVPQHFVPMEVFPRTPNGKIDRKALPAIESTPGQASLAQPASALEARVLAEFERRLGRAGVGLEDNFFEWGGHSLLAAQLMAALNRDLGLALPMRIVFEAPTVKALAARIGRDPSPNGDTGRIVVRPDQRTAPLSLQQQRVWFIEQLQPGNTMFNSPAAHRLRGPLVEAAFERAFNKMVQRQPSLRTVIREGESGDVQAVLDEVPVKLFPAEDLSVLGGEERESRLRARIRELTKEAFDFHNGPLFRARLFRLGPDEHVLVFVVHHIVWDGWSFDLFYDEINAHYTAFCNGQPSPLEPPLVSYGDFAAWQRQWLQGERLRAEVEHWKTQLRGHNEPLALPADRPRPAEASNSGITEWLNVSKEMTDRLHEMGRKADATLFMTLFAAYYAFLWKHTGQHDLVVGTPVRARSHAEVENLMGFFVNALAVRKQVDERMTFLDLVREVRATVLEALSHPDVPFEHLVRELRLPRDDSRFPIYQAFFSFQDARQRPSRWGNLSHERVPVFQAGLAEDCSAWFVERSFGLIGSFSLNADIFTRDTVRRYRDRFRRLLEAIVADPQQRVADLEVMAEEERQEIERFTSVGAALDLSPPVQSLFEQQVTRMPGRQAIRFEERSLTYGQIEVRANRLAHLLQSRGVGRGTLVGICLERSPDMVAAMLAVLKAGGAYLPLDPAFPASRLEFMVDDSRLALVISQTQLADRHGCADGKTLNLDENEGLIAAQPATRPATTAAGEDAAYVLYTSGSTGKPKGVTIPHRAALNFLHGMLREPGLAEADTLVAVTTLSFDIAFLELMLPLAVGARVVLAGRDQAMDGAALRQLIESSEASIMQATPVTWRLLIDAGWRGNGRFRALCGGEAMPIDLAEALVERTGELWNMYGPTETTVWSACWRVRNPRDGILVGRPIVNTTIRVLDEGLRACPLGVPGEIYIGGEGVALGYLNRPELTAERFIDDPEVAGRRLYKTGDLGRWREGGLLECLGRTDFQVKVRGHRIELGEIETALSRHTSVKQATVTVREDHPGDVRLVAYVIPAEDRVEDGVLRAHLRTSLPEYMVPQHFVALAAFPMTANGKIDRKALPAPEYTVVSTSAFSRPLGPTEKVIADVWSRIIGVSRIEPTDNFFDLGGHSFIAVRAIAEVEKAIGKRGALRDVIFLSLEQIAAAYDRS